jgi:hypothetical protein
MPWGPSSALAGAQWWLCGLAAGLTAESALGPSVVRRVRYEDLVAQPAQELKAISAHLNIEFEAQMIQGGGLDIPRYTEKYHHLASLAPQTSRIDQWRKRLKPREVEIIEASVGEVLKRLEYVPDYYPLAEPPSRAERLAGDTRDYALRCFVNPVRNWSRRIYAR